jgi:hypothetical protein
MAFPAPNVTSLQPRLEKMPAEIAVKITSHLTTPELGNFRLVCKELEQKVFNFFAYEFFRKKQFMLVRTLLITIIQVKCIVIIADISLQDNSQPPSADRHLKTPYPWSSAQTCNHCNRPADPAQAELRIDY